MFDWLRFLEQHRVEYNQTGPNTSRDNITIHCPFCGPNDPSKHMSINLSGKGWRCWRNTQHRGKNPARLIQPLLGVPFERASAIVGNTVYLPDDIMAHVQRLRAPPQDVEPTPLKLPAEFKAFSGLPSSRPYKEYLLRRGFSEKQIERLTDRYGVRYCTQGAYGGRIIFPVRFNRKLVSWTGRTISTRDTLRYRALSTDPERAQREGYPPALGAISHYLLWYDMLREADADTIVLAEGPFDALKVCVLGRRDGVVGTCFFTAEPTEPQVEHLHELLPRFKNRFVLVDRGALPTGLRIARDLCSLGVIPERLPPPLKDPGEFSVSTFDKFVLALRRGRP